MDNARECSLTWDNSGDKASTRSQKESILKMKLSHDPHHVTIAFDDTNLIGLPGLVPVMALAENAGLYQLCRQWIRVPGDRGANPHLKVASLVAAMVAGADSIDDTDILRHGGMDRLFHDVRAPSTLGSFLREFTFGHTRQLDGVASRFLLGLDRDSSLFGSGKGTDPVMVDMDATIIEVHSAKKQGARTAAYTTRTQGYRSSYAGKQGLSALLVTAMSSDFAPVILGDQLRNGAANSTKGAPSLVKTAITTLESTSVGNRQVWVRADSGFYNHTIVNQATSKGAWISVSARMNSSIAAAIQTIPDTGWTQIEYPFELIDKQTGAQISTAEVAEVDYTAFCSTPSKQTPAQGRLIIRRTLHTTSALQDPLFATWKYHPFFTTVPADEYDTVTVDLIHRQHAMIEHVNAELKASALAHLPSRKFAANTAWLTLASIAFNLTRALGTSTENPHFANATPATIRRSLIHTPARVTTSARRWVIHLPINWKWAQPWAAGFATLCHT
jgi:hypothetical protein